MKCLLISLFFLASWAMWDRLYLPIWSPLQILPEEIVRTKAQYRLYVFMKSMPYVFGIYATYLCYYKFTFKYWHITSIYWFFNYLVDYLQDPGIKEITFIRRHNIFSAKIPLIPWNSMAFTNRFINISLLALRCNSLSIFSYFLLVCDFFEGKRPYLPPVFHRSQHNV